MDDDSKILQLIPGNEWLAVFSDNGEDIGDPIVCFALVETTKDGNTYREVRPMLPDGKCIMFGDDAANYVGVRHANRES